MADLLQFIEGNKVIVESSNGPHKISNVAVMEVGQVADFIGKGAVVVIDDLGKPITDSMTASEWGEWLRGNHG